LTTGVQATSLGISVDVSARAILPCHVGRPDPRLEPYALGIVKFAGGFYGMIMDFTPAILLLIELDCRIVGLVSHHRPGTWAEPH
jgi:hypothetical protein